MNQPLTSQPQLNLTAPDLIRSLAADLAALPYTVEAIEGRLGLRATAALLREQPLPARLILQQADDPLATLIGFFTLGLPASHTSLDAALPTVGAAGLLELGLAGKADSLSPDADADAVAAPTTTPHLRATFDLRPVAVAATEITPASTHWLVSDLGDLTRNAELPEDYVLGVGGASVTLAQFMVRDADFSPRSILDLGTGCGVQALQAAVAYPQARIVATDISPRALQITQFNAALAGITVETRWGDMFEPVAGEEFDLVISNPPFVITPQNQDVPHYEYRDGGRAADDLVREFITGVGHVLTPGGVAQLLANWEDRTDAPWQERLAEWLDEAGLDAWIIQRETQDPAEYAELWLRDGGVTADRDRTKWRALYAQWLGDLDSRRVQQVGFGLVLLRKPGETTFPMRRIEELTGPIQHPIGPSIAANLQTHDRVHNLSDTELSTKTLQVAADVTIEHHLLPGNAHPSVILLRQGGGLRRAVSADTGLAGFVGACDGDLTAGQIIAGMAVLLEVDQAALAEELWPQVRGLVGDGFLTLPTRKRQSVPMSVVNNPAG